MSTLTHKLLKLFMNKEKLFNMSTYRVHSDKDILSIVESIKPTCQAYNFSILHEYIYHDLLESKGFPIKRKVYIYEICQAKVAALVLSDKAHFAPFMPCRLAIYEENNGVSISTQNMQMMLDMLKNNTALYKETTALFGRLKSLIHEIK